MHYKSVLLVAVSLLFFGCKNEVVKPKLSFIGIWNATYTLQSASSIDEYRLYKWTSTLTINEDGTAHAHHGPGNPVFFEQEVDEYFKWEQTGENAVYIRSNNWSVTNETMNYKVREYNKNYIMMDTFDDNFQAWTLVLKK